MRKVTSWLLRISVILVLVSIWLAVVVNPVVFNYANAVIDAVAVQAVNNGVADVVQADTYSSLTDIRRDSSGSITSISADAVAMNALSAQVSSRAQVYLEQMGNTGVPVPILTFSGIPFLVGRGVPVKLNLKLVGAVNCSFNSEFKTAGINQTEHKITLCSHAVVDVVLPFCTKRTQVEVEMLFSDSIIVGEVPEFLMTHTMS